MKDIGDLLEQLNNQLEQRVAVAKTANKLEMSMVIFYAGRGSLEAQADIERTLLRVWRARADTVCHFLMENDTYAPCAGGVSGTVLSKQEIINRIEDMDIEEDAFHKHDGPFFCLVQNTAQYNTLEEFCRDYLALDEFAKEFENEKRTMKLVLLDESNQARTMASQIKGYLHDELRNQNPRCRTTVLLSNRLSSGQLLKHKMLRENYVLAGNIILLSNGWNPNFAPVHSTLFPLNSPDLVTAAYSRITRPNHDICEVMVNALLEWLAQRFDKGASLSIGEINSRLGISGGTMKAITDGFKRNMSGNIPPRETLERLPRSIMSLEPLGGMPFDRFNAVTVNSFELFFEQNVAAVCRADSSVELFRQEFKRIAQGAFTPQEAESSLSPTMVDMVLKEINMDGPAKSMPAYAYLCRLVETEYCTQMLPICREVLLEVNKEAQQYIAQLRTLVDTFNLNYMLEVDATVQSCYEPLVQQSLNGEIGEEFLRQMNREKPTGADLLQAIFDVLTRIISVHPIFGMSLPEELSKRLGGNNNAMQTTVKQVLTERLSEKIRLRSAINPNKCLDVIMLDSKCDVFDFLKEMYPEMISMNTGNSSAVELIQFYRAGTTII